MPQTWQDPKLFKPVAPPDAWTWQRPQDFTPAPPAPEGPPSVTSRIVQPTLDAWNPLNMAKGVYHLLKAGLSTEEATKMVMSIGGHSADQAQQAVAAAKAGNYAQAAGHLGGAVPIIGKPFQKLAEGDIPGAIGETLALGSQVLVPEALGAAGRVAAPAVRASAEGSMVKALGKTGSAGPAGREMLLKAQDVAPRLVDEGFGALTAKRAAAKADSAREGAGGVLDDALSQVSSKRHLPSGPVINKLEAAKDEYYVTGTAGKVPIAGTEPQIKQIDAMIATLKGAGDFIPFEQIRNLRQKWDQLGNWNKANTTEQNATAELFRSAGNYVRSSIAKDQPGVAAANKDFSFWSDVLDVTARTAERPTQAAEFGTPIYTQVIHALRSPGFRYAEASVKARIAAALKQGDPATISRALSLLGSNEKKD